MKSRLLPAVFVVSAALFVFSCSHFVNLGDDDVYADNTEGLPDEFSEDRSDTESDANYDDWNEDYSDTGYDENEDGGTPEPADPADPADPTGPAEPTEEPEDSVDSDADPEGAPYNDEDNEMPDEDLYVFPESGDPFPEGFSNVECGCSSTPDYLPVCCDGKISVFNACFANCYAVKSGSKICSFYEPGLCGGTGITRDLTEGDGEPEEPSADEDEETDNDTELPDEDADPIEISNECGCYPEDDTEIFSCGEDSYAITTCLANCICDDPQKLFF